jgi:peptidoglycan/LPS O-acetylase OafA/YrhL
MLNHLGERRLDFLDQIRAIAILPVVITHYHSSWFAGGGMGVGIFFALSGFLITSLLLEEPSLNGRVIRRFYVRRLSRIYPLYVLMILTTTLLTYLFAPQRLSLTVGAIPGLLSFLQNSPWIGFSFGVLWTLQVEAWFYITLPLVMWFMGPRRGVVIFCAFLTLAAPTTFFVPAGPALLHWGIALATGAFISLIWKNGMLARVNPSPTLLAIFGFIGIAILLFPGPEPRFKWFLEVLGASLCGSALITSFLLSPTLPVLPGLPFIGRISYSMYLLHAVILDFAKPVLDNSPVPRLLRPEIYLFLVIGLSFLTYRLAEKPGIWVGKKIIAGLESQRVAPAKREIVPG